jgi:hypothetical protein
VNAGAGTAASDAASCAEADCNASAHITAKTFVSNLHCMDPDPIRFSARPAATRRKADFAAARVTVATCDYARIRRRTRKAKHCDFTAKPCTLSDAARLGVHERRSGGL